MSRRIEDEMRRILESGDRTKMVKALARLIREEEKREDRMSTLRRVIGKR